MKKLQLITGLGAATIITGVLSNKEGIVKQAVSQAKTIKKNVIRSFASNDNKAKLMKLLVNQRNMIVTKDIAYAEHPRLKLDVYQPKDSAHGRPVLFFVHGGSWNSGSKEDYAFLAESFTQAGYVVVIINYRLAPEHKYPDYVQDTLQALKWVTEHISEYGGHTQKIFAIGHSAGAFNVSAALNNATFIKEANIDISAIKAVIGIAGPYSYDFRTDISRTAFPDDGDPDDIMPNRMVMQNPIPHLLLLADKDGLVRDYNTEDMQKSLQDAGGAVKVVRIKNTNHITIIATCAKKLGFIADTRQVILDYMKAQLDE